MDQNTEKYSIRAQLSHFKTCIISVCLSKTTQFACKQNQTLASQRIPTIDHMAWLKK